MVDAKLLLMGASSVVVVGLTLTYFLMASEFMEDETGVNISEMFKKYYVIMDHTGDDGYYTKLQIFFDHEVPQFDVEVLHMHEDDEETSQLYVPETRVVALHF